ncbi:MAG: hypothetical protein ACI4I2_07435 [Oscillospiraceae bacterium]
MPRCPLCGKESSLQSIKLRLNENEGTAHYICGECHENITSLVKMDDNYTWSLNYINKYICSCEDQVLCQWLKNLIYLYNGDKEGSIEINQQEYTAHFKRCVEKDKSDSSNTTFWISSLKGVYKIVFFVIIIIGIVLCAMFCSNESVGVGFIALAIAVIAAVLVVGFAMVFLDLARDIHQIKNILEEQRNDEE